MKKILHITLIFAACTLALMYSQCCQATDTFTRPASLHPGDKVAIISPASVPERSYVEGGAEVLRSWGLVPVYGKHVLSHHGNFAGNVSDRRSDLEWAFADDSIKAIMCSRGGYGSIQELLVADTALMRSHPKWLIGYSDITALHGCLQRQGVMSLHAHMLEHLNRSAGTDSCDVYLRDIIFGQMPTYTLPAENYNQHGSAQGRLVGGNLSLLTSLIGTPFDMLHPDDDTPLILFIEDIGENFDHLNRMFYQLVASGVMKRVHGVIFGDFTGFRPASGFSTVEEMFHSIVKDYNIPVCYKFPCGHVSRNYPMVEGATVSLTVDSHGTTLQFNSDKL